MAAIEISAIVINYNGVPIIRDTIESLKNGFLPPKEIIIIDNGSHDNSLSFIRKAFPDIKLITLPKGTNSSFYTANYARDLGIRLAKFNHVLITDNDIIFHDKCLHHLASFMNLSERIASCTPRLFFKSEPNIINMDGGSYHFVGSLIAHNRDMNYKNCKDERPRKSTGCGIMLLRRDAVLKVGSFDPDYKLAWGDDASLQLALKIAGFECWHLPQATALHYAKRYSSKNPYRITGQIYNRWRLIITVYRIKTIMVILPALCFYELCLIAFSIKVKSFKEYYNGVRLVFNDSSSILARRKTIQRLRKLSDRELMSSGMMYIDSKFLRRKIVAYLYNMSNYILNGYWRFMKKWL